MPCEEVKITYVNDFSTKITYAASHQCPTPVILASQEAEIRRITV
jgi:hypothetical protein